MILFILTSIVVIFGMVQVFVSVKMNNNIKEFAFDYGKSISDKYALQIQADLNHSMGLTKAFTYSLYGLEDFEQEMRDSLLEMMLKNVLDNNRELAGVWANFELTYTDPTYNLGHGRKSTSSFINEAGYPDIFSELRDMDGHNENSSYYALKNSKEISILEPYSSKLDGINDIYMSSFAVPILHGSTFVGLAGVDVALDYFNDLISEVDLYDNSIISIISYEGTIIANSNKDFIGGDFLEKYPQFTEERVLQKIKKGKSFSFIKKFDEHLWFSAFSPIIVEGTTTPWAFQVSIPLNQILAKARTTMLITVITIILSLVLVGFVILMIAKNITQPISLATKALKNLSEGDIDIESKVNITSGDEIEDMGNSVNALIDGLNKTEQFAREIENGNLDSTYDLLGEKDKLGHALVSMRDSLKIAKKHEEERKVEEEKQNWTTQGIAKFSEILRRDNDNLENLSFNILSNLVNYVGAIQGGLFLLNENDSDDVFIEMMACYAYDRKKFLEKRIEKGEGLIGRCFIERKTIYMTDIPNDYVNITSGLGKENPSSILIVPLSVNDVVYGVIEIASFKEIEDYKRSFVEKVGESIASTVSSVKINVKTAALLEQTQQQAEEMAAQEEEMRQNMEELQATQEEMQRKESGYIQAIDEMKHKEEQIKSILGELEIQEDKIKERIQKIQDL